MLNCIMLLILRRQQVNLCGPGNALTTRPSAARVSTIMLTEGESESKDNRELRAIIATHVDRARVGQMTENLIRKQKWARGMLSTNLVLLSSKTSRYNKIRLRITELRQDHTIQLHLAI